MCNIRYKICVLIWKCVFLESVSNLRVWNCTKSINGRVGKDLLGRSQHQKVFAHQIDLQNGMSRIQSYNKLLNHKQTENEMVIVRSCLHTPITILIGFFYFRSFFISHRRLQGMLITFTIGISHSHIIIFRLGTY